MSGDRSTTRALGLVTGASSGIGRALVDEFVAAGLDVLAVADEDVCALPDGARYVRADLATPQGNDDVVEAITLEERPVVAAALNAGRGVSGRFDETPLAAHLQLVAVNIVSPLRLAHHLTSTMAAQGFGRILVTSSVAAQGPGPYQSTYAASKAFLHAFARALRYELRDTGVTVTSLLPGPTDTLFFERADMGRTWIARGPKADPADVAREAFAAMTAGKASIVPGSWFLKVESAVSALMPEGVATRLQAALARPRGRDRQT
ncbi:SDR family NAD(P)-dependent oxidoreductase [Mumia quercus]|uniref:SDR family NAD(P)-dependent oxidoreductase n=1 Tax=Mumia quercus TaxID=2976125 RepID=UPI0021CE7549|nr:SDR family NAD(P)-dependent oxidoreductase [Mumia quercus]